MQALSFAALLGIFTTVHAAEPAILRVLCAGDDEGAEITINGRYKGECPIDIQIPAGTVRLEAVKRLLGGKERNFVQEFRLGEGVAKRFEVHLGEPVLSEAAKRQLAAQEQRETEMYRNLPIPPRTTASSLADLWPALEASPAYLRFANLMKHGTLTYTTDNVTTYSNNTKSMWKTAERFEPVQAGVSRFLSRTTNSRGWDSTDGWTNYDNSQDEYDCLFGCMLMINHARKASEIDRYDNFTITGSLFPPRVGATMTISYVHRFVLFGNPEVRNFRVNYEIVEKLLAAKVNPAFPGDAWRISQNGSPRLYYYVEALGYYMGDWSNALFKYPNMEDYTEVAGSTSKTVRSNRRLVIGD